jgi:hypothetical protein
MASLLSGISSIASSVGSGVAGAASSMGKGVGNMAQGYMGGFGEGAGIPQLSQKFPKPSTPNIWANLGRKLGEQGGMQLWSQGPAASKLMELANRSPEEKKKKPRGDIVIPGEEYYMGGGKD